MISAKNQVELHLQTVRLHHKTVELHLLLSRITSIKRKATSLTVELHQKE